MSCLAQNQLSVVIGAGVLACLSQLLSLLASRFASVYHIHGTLKYMNRQRSYLGFIRITRDNIGGAIIIILCGLLFKVLDILPGQWPIQHAFFLISSAEEFLT